VRLLLPALVVLLAACGGRSIEQGRYAFTRTEVSRDSCGLLEAPEALWDGVFIHSNDAAWIDYDLFDTRLSGTFLEASEAFRVAGSAANVEGTVRGDRCHFDLVNVQISGTPESGTAFVGEMTVDFLAYRRPDCNCEVSTRYRAVKVQE